MGHEKYFYVTKTIAGPPALYKSNYFPDSKFIIIEFNTSSLF